MDFIVTPDSHRELAQDKTCYKHTQHILGSVPIHFFLATLPLGVEMELRKFIRHCARVKKTYFQNFSYDQVGSKQNAF